MSMNILTHRDGPILRIEIHRPDKKNALTQQMYADVAAAMGTAEADPGVRVMLIHGSEEAFTAGNDLQDFLSRPPRSEDSGVMRFLRTVSSTTKPLVAAVSGPAVGIGTTMLLHCDLVYAAEDARLSLPFVNLGLCPEAASSYLLPLVAGYQRAAELLLFGEPFSAEKGREVGIVTAVVPREKLMDTAMAAARKLAERPPAALRITKQLMKRAMKAEVEEALAEEFDHFSARLESPEAKEAMTAFFEKRKPDFSRFG